MKITFIIKDVVKPNGQAVAEITINTKCGRKEDMDTKTLANVKAKKIFDALGLNGGPIFYEEVKTP